MTYKIISLSINISSIFGILTLVIDHVTEKTIISLLSKKQLAIQLSYICIKIVMSFYAMYNIISNNVRR